ncbi:MAG TPA: hypothetical protein VJJ76_00060, partial [archaeon]|nr:hypothetical protein [archaeon]
SEATTTTTTTTASELNVSATNITTTTTETATTEIQQPAQQPSGEGVSGSGGGGGGGGGEGGVPIFITTTATTTTVTTPIVTSVQTTFEVIPGSVADLSVTIGAQTFKVKATNELYTSSPVPLKPPRLSFDQAAKIAYDEGKFFELDQIRLQYHIGEPLYIVYGLAKDRFYNFEVDNLRIVKLDADSGDVVEILKENVIFSFIKTVFVSAIKVWFK